MLLVWNEPKIAYLHVPKTGGTSTRYVLNDFFGHFDLNTRETVGVHQRLEEIEFDYLDYQLYTTIRNPYQHVISFYNWINHNMTFTQFVYWYVENGKSYSEWLFVNGGLPDITILKTETLDEDLEKIFGPLKKKYDAYNMKNKHYSEYFNRELYDKINEKYKWCFDQGYYDRE
jgi:hypothetical protein